MKKLSFYLIALLLIPVISFTGCKDDEKVEPAFTTLTNYLTANNMDLSEILTYHGASGDVKFVAGPPADGDAAAMTAFLAKYYIIDIRQPADYAAGHIDGAKNVTFGSVLGEIALAGDQPILVVCYSGQTACYATALLRLSGAPDAQALKWGMSGWNPANAVNSWDTKIGANEADGHNNWSTAGAPTNVTYDAPVLTETGDGATILAARIATVVAAGFGPATASGSDVLTTPTNYFINNYFSDADYAAFGHIDGAFRIQPLTVADGQILNLDPAADVVTYCYTGQTSAVITAYLRVLGYDAYTMTYGMNGIYNTNAAWSSNQWGVDSNPKNHPVVTK